MNEGIDTTKPVQLRPYAPGTRIEWSVPKSDGYLHVVTASVWPYENPFYPVGTINVRIGCATLITDTVQDGETEWEALRRVVTTWQTAQRDMDHAEALAMVPPAENASPAVRPCDYCHTDQHAGCPDCGTHPYMPGGRCTPCQAKVRRAEREAGKTPRELYGMYISDGLSDTDGYFAPLSFKAWSRSEGHAL